MDWLDHSASLYLGPLLPRKVKIVTNFIYPPIPQRQFDWSAVTDDYEGGQPIGYGETEAAAVADLMEQLEDMRT